MDNGLITTTWPTLPTFSRLALAIAVGLFVGLERERRGKEAGMRTFGFAALLGCLGALLGTPYALLSIGLLGLLITLMNWHRIHSNLGVELTTTAALLVTGFNGVLCGLGHTFTPVAIAVVTAALLAWKEQLVGFSLGLTEAEVRSAILLAILTFVIYPVLPITPLDPWDLIEPREAWMTVILIATIGFVNYILLKVYGARGVELTGFLGGLVNSTVTVAELAARIQSTAGRVVDTAYRGVLLATTAMLVRNMVLLELLSPSVLLNIAVPLALMLLGSVGLAFAHRLPKQEDGSADKFSIQLESPFSLKTAIKFGLIFLVLQVAGTIAQEVLGQAGFYAVSLAGGFISSASAVASAATLAAHGTIPTDVAGIGAILASLTSALANLIFFARIAQRRELTLRLMRSVGLVILFGLIGMGVQMSLLSLVIASR